MYKTIVVNLWDDYRQKPEYDINETTYLIIEPGIRMDDDSLREIRELIFERCSFWKKFNLDYSSWDGNLRHIDLSDVHFSRSMKPQKIDIIGLDTKSRHSLFGFLRKCPELEFNGIPVRFVMES